MSKITRDQAEKVKAMKKVIKFPGMYLYGWAGYLPKDHPLQKERDAYARGEHISHYYYQYEEFEKQFQEKLKKEFIK